jgi:hypothetical protein
MHNTSRRYVFVNECCATYVLNFCLKLVTDAKEEYDNAYLFLVHMTQTYCGQLGGTAVIPNVLKRRFSASSIHFFTEKIKSDSFIYSPNLNATTWIGLIQQYAMLCISTIYSAIFRWASPLNPNKPDLDDYICVYTYIDIALKNGKHLPIAPSVIGLSTDDGITTNTGLRAGNL